MNSSDTSNALSPPKSAERWKNYVPEPIPIHLVDPLTGVLPPNWRDLVKQEQEMQLANSSTKTQFNPDLSKLPIFTEMPLEIKWEPIIKNKLAKPIKFTLPRKSTCIKPQQKTNINHPVATQSVKNKKSVCKTDRAGTIVKEVAASSSFVTPEPCGSARNIVGRKILFNSKKSLFPKPSPKKTSHTMLVVKEEQKESESEEAVGEIIAPATKKAGISKECEKDHSRSSSSLDEFMLLEQQLRTPKLERTNRITITQYVNEMKDSIQNVKHTIANLEDKMNYLCKLLNSNENKENVAGKTISNTPRVDLRVSTLKRGITLSTAKNLQTHAPRLYREVENQCDLLEK